MANGLEIKGDTFRLTLDDFSGTLNGDSLADALSLDEYATFKNVVPGVRGPARKRGSISYAEGSVALHANAIGAAFFDSEFYPGGYQGDRPFVTISSVSSTYTAIAHNGGTNYTLGDLSSAHSASYAWGDMFHPAAVTSPVGGALIAGTFRDGSASGAPIKPHPLLQFGGNINTAYSTGTAGMTNGSTTVTAGGGATFASEHIGAFLTIPGDAGTANMMTYRITNVSGGNITIDRAYLGTTAAKAYYISAAGTVHGSSSVWSTRVVNAACATIWQNRIIVGNIDESTPGVASRTVNKNRLRWSGLIGSSEGASGLTGIHGWDDDGYIDLGHGAIYGLVPWGSSLLVFCEDAIVVVRGTPIFDDPSAVDASTVYKGFRPMFCSFNVSREGVFFYDRSGSVWVWNDTGFPTEITGPNMRDKLRSTYAQFDSQYSEWVTVAVGVYKKHVFLFSGAAAVNGFVLNTETGSWSEIVGDTRIYQMFKGRQKSTGGGSAYNQQLVGLTNTGKLVNVQNILDNPGDTSADWNSTVFVVDIKTGHHGPKNLRLRPRKWYVTYKCTDPSTLNPYIALTVSVGLPGATTDSTTTSTQLVENTTAETLHGAIQIARDNTLQVRALQVNGAAVFELHSIVVEGRVANQGDSS